MNISATLHHVRELSTEMRALSNLLVPASNELGVENVGFVVETSTELQGSMTLLAQTPHTTNPLESRDFRHDLRNKVAVIKGFSDLMRMDLSPGDHWAEILDRLLDLTDQFVALLDQAKEQSATNLDAPLFA